MSQNSAFPKITARQRLIAALCIGFLSIAYLVGYVQFHRLPTLFTPDIPQLAVLAPPPAPPRPVFVPDAPRPQVQDGMAPIVSSIDTSQPVVFLTIDDGVHQDPAAAAKMREAKVPASLFLTGQYATPAATYFRDLAFLSGSRIQNHTLVHPELIWMTPEEQRHEICGASDELARVYGERPKLFRPPYGSFNTATLQIVAECGMQALVLWTAVVRNGAMHYQVGDHLRPGDIVLMHFSPTFQQDIQAFVDASRRSGLEPQLLEDWLLP